MEREQTKTRLPEQADKSRQTTLRIGAELYAELKNIANQSGLTVTSLLLIAIWNNILKWPCKSL